MAFYAKYPATTVAVSGTSTVQGPGTAGTPSGGVLSIQGVVGGQAVPISGSITATNPSVSTTGAAVPASATYVGMTVSGNLTGLAGTANGLKVDGSAATQPISGNVGLLAGSAIVGQFGIDQTTPGTTNGVQVNAALPAGTNIVGKVGIDQTTPGTTNGVQVNAALPAGSNTIGNVGIVAGTAIIGKVSIDQTTPGTTNGVQVNAALPAGTNIVGKFGIDQTTPGTTNGVQVNAALPAGSNIIGNFRIDQTTPGTTNGVQVNAAIPAGTNVIGKVSIDQTTPGTTNAVQVTALPLWTTTTATFQAEGSIAAGSITTSFATVFTPSSSTKMIFLRNNTNGTISVSFDAGTTTNVVMDPMDQMSFDLAGNGLVMPTTAIQIKYTGTAPTSGSFRVNGAH